MRNDKTNLKIYKELRATFLMLKNQLQQQLKKACFGTKEWSKNSGICNRCELKEKCGEIDAIKKSKIL